MRQCTIRTYAAERFETKMGTNLRKLVRPTEIDIVGLKHKTLAVDAHNQIYQFLTVIRQRNGEYLRASDGRITSHLLGLLPRTSNLLSQGIKLAYVFDGPPPKLKERTIRARSNKKIDAKRKLAHAKEAGETAEMKKYAARTTRLTPEIVDSSKRFLEAIGVPVVQAPSEADAQTAFMVKNEDCYAAASTDYDTLLHGSPRLVRRLSKSQRGKRGPEILVLEEILDELGVTRNELIAVAIMMGTDYHPGGIRGIGPKRGLKLVKQNDILEAFEKAACDFDWQAIMDLYQNMETVEEYSVDWEFPDDDAIRTMLVDEYEFSEETVEKRIREMQNTHERFS
ncbi:flap endonuclease-1 [Candidatus Thorarchaeota archaeon]|nr:MAG: flap endonuclease-1 [Candidatus Thorarchaeota archaeon]